MHFYSYTCLFRDKKIKSNNLISEKYISTGLYLSTKDIEKSKNFYEEIILSKNKFYSV